MNVTIKTLTVQVDEKSAPLTKAMVNQLPYLEGCFCNNDNYKDGADCSILGEVSITDGLWILVSTPHGVQRTNIGHTAFKEILKMQGKRLERIILLK